MAFDILKNVRVAALTSVFVLISSLALAVPSVPPGFTATLFSANANPGGAVNSFGNLALGNSGGLYSVGGFSSNVFAISSGGVASNLTTLPTGNVMGALNIGGNLYAGGGNGQVYKINTTTNTTTVLPFSLAGEIQDIVQAPLSFGSHGGRIFVSTTAGIYEISASENSVTQFAGGNYDALAFTNDGRLLASNYNQVMQFNTSLTQTLFSNTSGIDGLAVSATGQIFATNSNVQRMQELSSVGATSTFATFSPQGLDGGFYPTGLIFDALGTTMYFQTYNPTFSGPMQIYQVTGFAGGAGVPAPGALALLGLGLLGLGGLRSKRAA